MHCSNHIVSHHFRTASCQRFVDRASSWSYVGPSTSFAALYNCLTLTIMCHAGWLHTAKLCLAKHHPPCPIVMSPATTHFTHHKLQEGHARNRKKGWLGSNDDGAAQDGVAWPCGLCGSQ